jgi:hypothetical protein
MCHHEAVVNVDRFGDDVPVARLRAPQAVAVR